MVDRGPRLFCMLVGGVYAIYEIVNCVALKAWDVTTHLTIANLRYLTCKGNQHPPQRRDDALRGVGLEVDVFGKRTTKIWNTASTNTVRLHQVNSLFLVQLAHGFGKKSENKTKKLRVLFRARWLLRGVWAGSPCASAHLHATTVRQMQWCSPWKVAKFVL